MNAVAVRTLIARPCADQGVQMNKDANNNFWFPFWLIDGTLRGQLETDNGGKRDHYEGIS